MEVDKEREIKIEVVGMMGRGGEVEKGLRKMGNFFLNLATKPTWSYDAN